jgi:TolB-like protein/AraC-like DNA-binding protein/cytochrome c-type biogenesis protein CcmH/NrfG
MSSIHWREKSIAVLPFANLSENNRDEYFGDGITEEIINGLTRVKNLKVTSRTSSFYFKNRHIPIRQIGEQLKVEIVLEGSVRIVNDKVRITAQLIEARDDYHFWSESWDRSMDNVFDVQDEISLLIADKLREHLGHLEFGDHLVNKKTNRPDAYDLWLRARFYFNKWNPADVETAIGLFEKAIAIDPHFADAWVGLADAYSFMATTQFLSPAVAWEKSVFATHKALSIDPENAGVHYLLANLSFFTDSNYSDSLVHATKAVELKSSYPEARQYMAFLYILSGETEKALHHLQLALATDPLNQETLFYKAYYLYRTGKYSEALEMYDNLLEKNPENIPAFVVRAYCLLFLKRFDEVLPLIENASAKKLIENEKLGILCLISIFMNDDQKTDFYIRKLKDQAHDEGASQAHSYLFLAYANTHRFDDAFDLLEQAIRIKSPILLLVYTDPLVNGIVDDLRYGKYHEKLFGNPTPSVSEPARKPLLDASAAADFQEKLIEYMTHEKPFLEPSLSLRSLASQISIHPNQLSWLLNEHMGNKFNEFVNQYRLRHFMDLAQRADAANLSIMGMAYESGFNSKTVFNTFFKKETGLTPQGYLRELGRKK